MSPAPVAAPPAPMAPPMPAPAAYSQPMAPPPAPVAPPAQSFPPAAPPAQEAADPNANPFGTQSLEWQGNDNDPSAKTVRLRDRLQEADVERRKEREEAEARERAAEIRREERLKKIHYLESMPDNTPAGTGTYLSGVTVAEHLDLSNTTFHTHTFHS